MAKKRTKYTWFAVDEDEHPYIFADTDRELAAKLGLCPSAVSCSIRFNRVYDNFSDLRKECITTLNHSGYSFNFWGYDNSETEKIFNEYVEKMNGDKDEGPRDQKKKSS